MFKIKENLVDQLYEYVKECIVNVRLRPGERINMQKLATEFGVSQTPVREMLKKLSEDGLIKIVPRVGYYVVDLSAKDIREVYDLRRILEIYALESAVRNISKKKLQELKENMKKLQREINEEKKNKKFRQLDREFHWSIIQSSPNVRLHKLFSQIYNIVILTQHINQRVDESLKEHITLVDAVMKRDIDKAKEILKTHINNSKEEVINVLKRGIY